MAPPYLSIEQMLLKVSEPDCTILQTILEGNLREFEKAMGSEHNHQAWQGGYLDHVTETMNLACVFYEALGERLPFTLSSALKIMFLHDIEKPWRFIRNGKGRIIQKCLKSKKDKADFRKGFLDDYGVSLTGQEHNAMRYVEGEHRRAKPSERVEKPLVSSRFPLSADVLNALTYIEGSHGDYRNRNRSEGLLATFCHLWWVTTFAVRPQGTTFTLKSLYHALHDCRPLPFTLRDAETVRALYLAEQDSTDYKHHILALHGLVSPTPSEDQWRALTDICRYPCEDSIPRRMGSLAAFCHMCDVTSARLWHAYPQAKEDPWTGASRSKP